MNLVATTDDPDDIPMFGAFIPEGTPENQQGFAAALAKMKGQSE
jgi:hypothetical protein